MTDPDDTHDVRTEGDDLVVETPFGTARYELKDANAAADDQLLSEEEWPDDYELSERWRILIDEVDAALVRWLRQLP